MNGSLPILIIVGLAILLPLLWLIAVFNRLTRTRQHIRESWADIDVELKRRYDLIPNLIETVKGYASHERELFERVASLRNTAAANHGPAIDQSRDETQLQLAVGRLFAVAESYPRLKADENFRALQLELANTEDRIAAARRFFNANVRELNTMCQTLPTNVVASLFGFKPQTYFELASDAERVVPRVSL